MRGGVAIQGDHPRGSMLFSRPGKEPLGGCNVTPFAQEKVDGSTLLIDGAIEVDPLPFDFDVGFIHTPGVADWPCVMIPALFKLRDILLHPPKNSRMGQSDATFRHHSDEVTEAQFKCDVPSHTQNDDLLVKVPPLNRSCAEVGSVIPAVIAGYRAFQQFAPEPCVEEALESEHRAHAAFYPPVILFDDLVQVGTISNLDGIVPTVIEFVIHPHAPQSGMGGLEAIQGNYSRLAVALESFTEEGLGGGDVTRSTEVGFDGFALLSTER